jgi:phosphatidylserine/phosphatidylglycerophosphate/cardiolipin synthase-like enzyme
MGEGTVHSTKDNNIQYFIDGENIYPQIIDLIGSAKKSIYVEVFLFYDDESGMGMVDKLVEKAREGLDVRVLLSEKGMQFNNSFAIYNKLKENNVKVVSTFPLPKIVKDIWELFDCVETESEDKKEEFFEVKLRDPVVKKISLKSQKIMNKIYKKADKGKTLKDGGFFIKQKRKKIFRTIKYYDHRKIILVDNKRAFMGGMNFGNDYLFQGPPSELGYFHDIGILVEGSIIKEVLKLYMQVWHLFSAEKTVMALPRGEKTKKETRGIDITTISAFPKKIPNDIRQAYLREIKTAKNYIYIINLYLTDIELIEELIYARKRGVEVHIISTFYPGKLIESMFTRLIYRGYFYLITCKSKLQDYGIKLHHYTKYNVHAKVCIVDDHWVTIGSSNLDYSSLRNALEINVSLTDPPFIKSLKKELFLKDFEESNILNKKLSIFKKLYYFICYIIFSIGEKKIL